MLINDVWHLHLNGRMTDSGDIWNRYRRIGNILKGNKETKGFVKGFLTDRFKEVLEEK